MIYFKESEFYCSCKKCGLDFDDMDEDLILDLDRARDYAKVPFIIVSSIRCIKHNSMIGGVKSSSHLKGYAVDIKCSTSYARYRVVYGLRKAGFTRIGIGNYFIHADKDLDKPKELIWLY